jgi:hypothetical protein
MKTKRLQTRTSTLLLTLLLFLAAGWSNTVRAQEPFNCGSAMVWTDKEDYAPGEFALISGSGWMPGETVDLVLFSTNLAAYEHFEMVADGEGNFTGLYYEILEIHLGEEFVLDAYGMTSGCEAFWYFTDGNFSFNANGLTNNQSITVNYSWPQGSNTISRSRSFTTPNTSTTDGTANSTVTFLYNPSSFEIGNIKRLILNYTYAVGTGPTISTSTSNIFNSGPAGAANARIITANYGALVAADKSAAYGESVNLTATFYSNYETSTGISGKTITFYLKGTSDAIPIEVGTAVTNASGVATLPLNLINVQTLGKLNAGTYAITASFAGDGSYLTVSAANSTAATLTVTQRPITITAEAKSKVYGQVDPALTYQITNGSIVSGDVATGVLSRAAGENVATYAIQKNTFTYGSNYDITYVGALLTINQLAVTVAADAKSKTYGQVDPGLTFVSSPAVGDVLANGEVIAFTGALSRVAGEDVGTYDIEQNTVANSNYAITYTGALLTINQLAVTVTADAKSKTYGQVDPGLTFVSSPAVGDVLANGEVIAFTGALSRVAGEDVGTYDIEQNTVANSNYAITYTGALLTINQLAVTVTADAKSKTYGQVDPGLTFVSSPAVGDVLANGEVIAFTGALSRDAGETVGSYAILQGTRCKQQLRHYLYRCKPGYRTTCRCC